MASVYHEVLSDSKMCCFQAGEPGVVVLRPEALAREARDSDSDCEVDGAPPSPCAVRFVNDNVLINGRSSMPARPDRDRIAKVYPTLLTKRSWHNRTPIYTIIGVALKAWALRVTIYMVATLFAVPPYVRR